jgi:hypothetical protein
MGLDSLLAIELRNRFEANLELTFPVTLVWTYPTIAELATYLASEMNIVLESAGELAHKDEQQLSLSSDEKESVLHLVEALEKLSMNDLQSMLTPGLLTQEGPNE